MTVHTGDAWWPGGVRHGRSGREDDPLLEIFGPDRVRTFHVHLTRPSEAARLFQAAIDWQGRVDVLVNDAEISLSLALAAPLNEQSRL